MSSGLFVCMVLWEPFIGCFIGCFIGGRLLCGVCLTYSRQRPERSRMAIAEGCRLGGFLCPYAERTYGVLRLPEITLSGFSRSVFRLFSIVCFARLYYVVGCFRVVSGCALSFRPFGRKRPKGAMSVAAQCSVIRWLPSPARVKRSRGGAGAVSAGVWPGLLAVWGFSEFSGHAGSGGVALPVFRSAGSGAGVSPASEAVVAAAVVDGVAAVTMVADGVAVVAASVVAAVGIADASVADGVAAVAAASVVAAVGIADASGVFVIVSTVVFADCGGISPLSGSMRRMRWRIWRPSQRNSTTSPGCRA